jgi:tetratricopeptide (TPR) repeat protein
VRGRVYLLLLIAIFVVNTGCNRTGALLEKAARFQKQGDPAKALAIYQAQLAKSRLADHKFRSQLQYDIGECLSQLARVPEAYGSYVQAVESDSQNLKAHFRLGEIYLMAGELERLSDEANFLIKNGGDAADAFSLIGAAAQASNKDDVAREAFERVLKLEPTRVKIALDLADLYNRAGNTAKSREVLKQVAVNRPDSSLPWLTLGRLEEQEGNIKDAEEAYLRAVSVENTPDTNLRLAQFYERSARVVDARSVLHRVDTMRPNQPPASADFQLAAGETSKANDGYLSALQGAPRTIKDPWLKLTHQELIARLIESDLAKSDVDRSDQRNNAIADARQHLNHYGAELGDAERSLLEAEFALANDDLVQASIHAAKALQAAPQSAAAHYVSAIVRYRSSDAASARSEWQQAIDIDGAFVPARIALAEDSIREGDFSGAGELILPVVRQEPSNIQALVIFARALTASRSFDSAQNITSRIQALAPRSPYPHILRGEAALNQRNFATALIEFQEAVLLDTHSKDAIDGLTRVYAVAPITRSMLLKMERMGLAAPSSATLLEIAGRNFINIHRYEDAERCLRESLLIDPSRHSAVEWLARIQAQNGDLTSASRSVAKVQEFSPMLAGVEAEQQHDLAAAIDHYDRAVRSGDTTGVAANNLAWIFAQQNRELDRALDLANKARELQPENPAVLDTLGLVHLVRREYTDAITVLEHAQKIASVKTYPDQDVLAEVCHHLAEAYLRTGQTKRAALVNTNSGSRQ